MNPLRVKLNARGQNAHHWQGQLPDGVDTIGGCRFILEKDDPDYDWLVVIDDVSRQIQKEPERLACADEHTLLVTTEPPTITRYARGFSGQFAHVLTSQPESTLPHPGRIHSHTGNLWFCGHRFSELDGHPLLAKTSAFSTVCSSKQQKHTLHNERYRFTQWLSEQIPELEMFGHGVRYVDRKSDALDPYRFHLAIENYRGKHHWTEKLADAFLCSCVPIYYGCENVADYFPVESFVEIDLFDREGSLEQIRELLADPNHYEKRREALIEARRRVLHEHNLFHMIARIVEERYQSGRPRSGRPMVGRRQMRWRRPTDAVENAVWKIRRTLG